MKKILIYLFIFIGILSCRKEDSSDKGGVIATLNQKAWFQQMKVPCDANTICKTSIYKAQYNNETVVYSILGGALCDPYFSVQLRNLNGEVVKNYSGPYDLSPFEKEVTNKELIYICK
jgi:hypothetical protein